MARTIREAVRVDRKAPDYYSAITDHVAAEIESPQLPHTPETSSYCHYAMRNCVIKFKTSP